MHSHRTVLPALLRWFGGFADSFAVLNSVNGVGVLDTALGLAGVTQCQRDCSRVQRELQKASPRAGSAVLQATVFCAIGLAQCVSCGVNISSHHAAGPYRPHTRRCAQRLPANASLSNRRQNRIQFRKLFVRGADASTLECCVKGVFGGIEITQDNLGTAFGLGKSD